MKKFFMILIDLAVLTMIAVTANFKPVSIHPTPTETPSTDPPPAEQTENSSSGCFIDTAAKPFE